MEQIKMAKNKEKKEKTTRTSRSKQALSEVFSSNAIVGMTFDESDIKLLKISVNTSYKDAKAKIRGFLGLPEKATKRSGVKGELRALTKEMTSEEIKKLLEVAKKLKA
jgi:hypothetical protein